VHVVFGSGTLGMQSPPVQVPLWQSLACAQLEPAGEPELVPPVFAPPELVAPLPGPPELEPPRLRLPPDVELSPPRASAPEPPPIESWHTPAMQG